MFNGEKEQFAWNLLSVYQNLFECSYNALII